MKKHQGAKPSQGDKAGTPEIEQGKTDGHIVEKDGVALEATTAEHTAEKEDGYVVKKEDVKTYPELVEQGVKAGQRVRFMSLWVKKYDSAEQNPSAWHKEQWPGHVGHVQILHVETEKAGMVEK